MGDRLFDVLVKRLTATGSRRGTLRGLAGGALAPLLTRLGRDDAAAKRKKHKQKLRRNIFGCVNVGGKCQGKSANCCSGTCEGKKPKQGKKDKSRCVAHNELDCAAGANSCLQAVPCGTNGLCAQTTGQASFCGAGVGICSACRKDADCEALGFGAGAACAVCIGCTQTGNTLCMSAAV